MATSPIQGQLKKCSNVEVLEASLQMSRKFPVVLLGMCMLLIVSLHAAAHGNPSEVQREILDPCLGSHWQLIPDAIHPGWPGHLILLEPAVDRRTIPAARQFQSRPSRPIAAEQSPLPDKVGAPQLIRVGDRVTIDQDSSVISSRFQGVALESASQGQVFKVRLRVGENTAWSANGPVIEVVAVAVDQASWRIADRIAR